MSATEVVLYEWTATLDEGVNATTGEPWRGHRVKYRRQGARRWASFLLTKDDGTNPTESEVLEAVRLHDGR